MATIVGEVQKTSTEMVVESEPVQISEQDDRKYKHITGVDTPIKTVVQQYRHSRDTSS